MNELRRNGKRTREQLTFSDTYLALDNLRNYDFDLVSFYVTFNQYIDRRNYEGEIENSLIFKNNESLFKAFNVSRNRFYRLLKLAYECGLIDIEKGTCNRNIYILNDVVPLKPLKKIREWKDREETEIQSGEEINEGIEEDILEVVSGKKEEIIIEKSERDTFEESEYHVKSYPKKGQPQKGQPVVPKKDNQLSLKGTTSYPEKVQPSNHVFTDDFNALDSLENTPNNSNVLIDLSFNNQSICQSIDNEVNNNINEINRTDIQTDIEQEKTEKMGIEKENRKILNKHINRTIESNSFTKQEINQFNYILQKAELEYVDVRYKDAVERALRELFFNNNIKIGGKLIPKWILIQDLEKINYLIIEHALNKFKEASKDIRIKNTVSYLASCIYNSISEINLDVDSEIRFNNLTY